MDTSSMVYWILKWGTFFVLISDCRSSSCYTTSTGRYVCATTETGEIAGIVIGATVGLAILISILVCCVTKCNKKKKTRARVTRRQVNEASRQDQMPPDSFPMYGVFPSAPPPNIAPPSYDSHNFNDPPPSVTVTGSGFHQNGIGFQSNDPLPPAY
ncbi:uncharacterized protein LOC125653936 isoform X2 [Ostrea edulis]|uniref:uncharacterized protein LOC125653936 isoform X2 n=1 Tax=Ostrea edulis TaxID=37623 RepID=UPI0024AEC08A|nr:uncharacterized protein LOC125653936 isoform X2 [Ostrea edulis]